MKLKQDQNPRELSRFTYRVFLRQVLFFFFQMDCPLKSLLFICSCQKHFGVQLVFTVHAGDLTPSYSSPFLWGMFTHARTHVCKRVLL